MFLIPQCQGESGLNLRSKLLLTSVRKPRALAVRRWQAHFGPRSADYRGTAPIPKQPSVDAGPQPNFARSARRHRYHHRQNQILRFSHPAAKRKGRQVSQASRPISGASQTPRTFRPQGIRCRGAFRRRPGCYQHDQTHFGVSFACKPGNPGQSFTSPLPRLMT